MIIRYLTHPQVHIDPSRDVRDWSLNEVGRARVSALAKSGALAGTRRIVSSAEAKAVETAGLLAESLRCPLEVRERMHENDRSATGYLPQEAFENAADQFFAHPAESFRGWETAMAAQARIVSEVEACLRTHTDSDLLFVGHGGVGTLLYCKLSGLAISRAHDQGPGGGGCYFEFTQSDRKPQAGWQPMEALANHAG